MERFVCENVFVPLRSGPSHKEEMLSQILFGEKYEVIDQIGHWMKIKTQFDNYTGWMDLNHLQHTEETDNSSGHVLNRSLLCYKSDKNRLVLEAGCEIYSPDFKNRTFMAGKNTYTTGDEFSENYIVTKESISDTAMKFINSPYIWGGRIPSGIDCSGFTQLVYKLQGKPILRDSWQQAKAGTEVSFIDETKPGDLVLFDDERRKISHVGMILSRGLVIHASGRVRIDSIDHQGIFKAEINDYSHHLRTIRRILV
jgi:cell wall-associated NlpC family hydrolase